MANLIVSDTLLRSGKLSVDASSFVRHLKPVGGVVCVSSAQKKTSDLKAAGLKLATWLEGAQLGKLGEIKTAGGWATLTRGKLKGAGSWSHQYGEPGNTAVGDDQLIGLAVFDLYFLEEFRQHAGNFAAFFVHTSSHRAHQANGCPPVDQMDPRLTHAPTEIGCGVQVHGIDGIAGSAEHAYRTNMFHFTPGTASNRLKTDHCSPFQDH